VSRLSIKTQGSPLVGCKSYATVMLPSVEDILRTLLTDAYIVGISAPPRHQRPVYDAFLTIVALIISSRIVHDFFRPGLLD
jgi:hypothetical protein